MIGPLYYPPANRSAQAFQAKYPGAEMNRIDKVVWHTTEGNGWPAYAGGSIAPHMTAFPYQPSETLVWRAHFPANQSSRSLVHIGDPITNTANVFQIEIIGTCDPAAHSKYPTWVYLPEAPDWVLSGLADFAKWAADNWDVPLVAAHEFQAYPSSYGERGATNQVRLNSADWLAYRGHLGHQHVPENVHGDPGALNMKTVLDLATGVNVPISPADASLIATTLLGQTVTLSPAAASAMSTPDVPRKAGDTVSLSYIWQWGGAGMFDLVTTLAEIIESVSVLQAQVTALSGNNPAEITAAFTAGIAALKAELASIRVTTQ